MSKVVSAAIKATEAYLELLDSQNLGRQRYSVRLKQGVAPEFRPVAGVVSICGCYEASPRLRLAAGDGAVYVDARGAEKTEARIVEYDRRSGELVLAFQKDELPPSPGDIETDMRWLVRQQLGWLEQRGAAVQTPFRSEVKGKLLDPAAARQFLALTPTEYTKSQREALQSTIETPVTYVWGPPGTGKTTKVLSQLLRGLVKEDKRVLLVGPTNTAVDNALLAVLPTLTAQEQAWTARLGTATKDLLERYPDVCEDGAIRRELAALVSEIEIIERDLESVKRIGRVKVRIDELASSHRAMLNQITLLSRNTGALERQQPALLLNVTTARKSVAKSAVELAAAERVMAELGFWARTFTGRGAESAAEIDRFSRVAADARRALASADLAYGRHAMAAAQTTRELEQLSSRSQELASERDSLVADLEGDPFMWRNLDVEQLRGLYSKLMSKRSQLLQRRKALAFSVENKRIIATTLDSFVARFRQTGLRVDWAILDEAGFAPLIKAIPLLSLACPLTLLGDHKQLEPIAEGDSDDQLIAQFWRRSAVHLDEVLRDGAFSGRGTQLPRGDGEPDDWLTAEVHFALVKKAHLLESFRFSDELASVLDRFVYRMQLRGRAPHPTRIFRIETVAKADKKGEKRVNVGEVDAVVRLVEDLRCTRSDRLVVLTPYKNQARAIMAALKERGLSDIEALNVHKAQGREWDTVIFSVVDGRLPLCRPWFTTSSKPAGTVTLNSALSRVRRELFIVCEKGYWIDRPEELLGDLLGLSTPFDGPGK